MLSASDDLSIRKLSERKKQHLARFPRSDMLAFLRCDTILLLVTRSERRSHFIHDSEKLEFCGHDTLQRRGRRSKLQIPNAGQKDIEDWKELRIKSQETPMCNIRKLSCSGSQWPSATTLQKRPH